MMLARVAKTQAHSSEIMSKKPQLPIKKPREVTFVWLFDGSQNDFSSLQLYCAEINATKQPKNSYLY